MIVSMDALGKPNMRNTHRSRSLRRKRGGVIVSVSALSMHTMRNTHQSRSQRSKKGG